MALHYELLLGFCKSSEALVYTDVALGEREGAGHYDSGECIPSFYIPQTLQLKRLSAKGSVA